MSKEGDSKASRQPDYNEALEKKEEEKESKMVTTNLTF